MKDVLDDVSVAAARYALEEAAGVELHAVGDAASGEELARRLDDARGVVEDALDVGMPQENQMDKFFIAPFVGKNANLEEPLISPIHGSYPSNFPATVIVTGTRDVVLSGSTRLNWKLRRASVPTELIVGEGMWHAYTSFPDIPESREARKASQEFLFAQLRTGNGVATETAHPSDAANVSAR